ncbi:MAG: hypothetical protein ACW967_09360 [Candidatus Hodarchaeales archaeon]
MYETTSTLTFNEMMNKKSPFEGRTYISIYIPANAPLNALLGQLKSEIDRSQNSTNVQIKGIAIMMLREIVEFLQTQENEEIPSPGRILFSIPKDHKTAYICYTKPQIGIIDLFTYNLDLSLYFDESYFE